ncbi:MAG: hypothetical protein LBL82_05935 [Oscillospiraceae bacterium]|jgi:hypothetical protein|nr:hypothetical protein [Oscillospiraceae bacterium]
MKQNMTNGCAKVLEEIYSSYLEELRIAREKQSPTDGLLGMGSAIGSNECHDRFAENVERAVADMAARPVSEEEAEAALWYILRTPSSLCEEDECAVLMLEAVQGLSLPLTALVSEAAAKELLLWYCGQYPKNRRLPSQNKLVKALEARAGKPTSKTKRRWF